MTDEKLESECSAYCKYLTESIPNHYVLAKYRIGHEDIAALQTVKTLFDRFLLWLPRNPAVLRIADVYTFWCHKNSLLRKKWFLLIAILESSPENYSYFDRPDSSSASRLIWNLFLKAALLALLTPFTILLLGPLHLFLKIFDGRLKRDA